MRNAIVLLGCLAATLGSHAQTWHIGEAHLPLGFRSLSTQQQTAIRRAIKPSLADLQLNPYETQEVFRKVYAQRIQIPGSSLLLVSGYTSYLCGAVGNCRAWIFDDRAHLLLDNGVGMKLTILSTYHASKPDILFTIHDSASETGLERWRFNGNQYLRSWCATSTLGGLEGHNKHPEVSSHACH